jgi:hypothetical protein
MPLSSVVGAQSIVKPGVCTSSTRPASPYDGQMIYETDTDATKVWNGSAWVGSTNAASLNGIGEAWTSYTPTVKQGATITTTINYAKYARINKVVILHVMLTCTSAGTANQVLTIAPPINTINSDAPYFGCNGVATFYDASAAKPYVFGVHSSSSEFAFVDITAGGNYFGAIPAVTIANGDTLSLMVAYEVA